jgi:hypothetical protein
MTDKEEELTDVVVADLASTVVGSEAELFAVLVSPPPDTVAAFVIDAVAFTSAVTVILG